MEDATETAEACSQAFRLYRLQGYTPAAVLQHIGSASSFCTKTRTEYMKLFDFAGMLFVPALRLLLQKLHFVGESQEKDRVLNAFASEYHTQQKKPMCSVEGFYVFATALLLLNSNLHAPNSPLKRTTLKMFMMQLRGLCDLPDPIIREAYESVKATEFPTAAVESARPSHSHTVVFTAKQPKDTTLGRLFEMESRLTDPRMTGPVSRKRTDLNWYTPTKSGNRSWNPYHCSLLGALLVFHEPEDRPANPEMYSRNVSDAFCIRHALASEERTYTKRPFVFRLCLADGGQYLLEASTMAVMTKWIEELNTVAALESAPPLPAAAASSKTHFLRPVLPDSKSKSTEIEQLAQFRLRIQLLEQHTKSLETDVAELSPLSKADERYFGEKREYFAYELRRYQTYIGLLEARIKKHQPESPPSAPSQPVENPTVQLPLSAHQEEPRARTDSVSSFDLPLRTSSFTSSTRHSYVKATGYDALKPTSSSLLPPTSASIREGPSSSSLRASGPQHPPVVKRSGSTSSTSRSTFEAEDSASTVSAAKDSAESPPAVVKRSGSISSTRGVPAAHRKAMLIDSTEGLTGPSLGPIVTIGDFDPLSARSVSFSTSSNVSKFRPRVSSSGAQEGMNSRLGSGSVDLLGKFPSGVMSDRKEAAGKFSNSMASITSRVSTVEESLLMPPSGRGSLLRSLPNPLQGSNASIMSEEALLPGHPMSFSLPYQSRVELDAPSSTDTIQLFDEGFGESTWV
eukprot:m.129416 g.129416  ORF g.129416 m.129416 type:complete len:742 (+) comp52314_c0_seq1:134-2359(+)